VCVCAYEKKKGCRGDINIACYKFSKAPAISQQIVNSKFCARQAAGHLGEGKRREGKEMQVWGR